MKRAWFCLIIRLRLAHKDMIKENTCEPACRTWVLRQAGSWMYFNFLQLDCKQKILNTWNMAFLKLYAFAALAFFPIDILWIGFIGNSIYKKQIGHYKSWLLFTLWAGNPVPQEPAHWTDHATWASSECTAYAYRHTCTQWHSHCACMQGAHIHACIMQYVLYNS